MHDLALAQKPYGVLNVVIVAKAQDIVISRARFLLP